MLYTFVSEREAEDGMATVLLGCFADMAEEAPEALALHAVVLDQVRF